MNTITITLVRTSDGVYVGRTASDRWNMETLALMGFPLPALGITKGHVDALRRHLKKMGLILSIARAKGPQALLGASEAEQKAMTSTPTHPILVPILTLA